MSINERIEEVEEVIERRQEDFWEYPEDVEDSSYDAGYCLEEKEEFGGNGTSFLEGYLQALEEIKNGTLEVE